MAILDTRAKDIRNLPGFGLTATLAVAFLYAPILFLVLYSFNEGRSISRFGWVFLPLVLKPFLPTRKSAGQR